jgi:diguanylate cyclase (GGDEF)-like protein
MKYTGRIAGTVILLLFVSFLFVEHTYLERGTAASVWFIGILFPLLWKLGERYDQAKYVSDMDTLTQIYSRRFVQDIFPKLTALTDRKNEKLSVTVIDVDNFKEINDRYGHKEGDHMLQLISKTLLENSRKSDIVVRWGGDEFIVIAPSTDQAGTDIMITRFESSLRQYGVSVSIGTSLYPDHATELPALIECADSRMYRVKIHKKAIVGGASIE